jgi:hypothetical protein
MEPWYYNIMGDLEFMRAQLLQRWVNWHRQWCWCVEELSRLREQDELNHDMPLFYRISADTVLFEAWFQQRFGQSIESAYLFEDDF